MESKQLDMIGIKKGGPQRGRPSISQRIEYPPRTNSFTVPAEAVIVRSGIVAMYRWFCTKLPALARVPPVVISIKAGSVAEFTAALPTRSISSQPTSSSSRFPDESVTRV